MAPLEKCVMSLFDPVKPAILLGMRGGNASVVLMTAGWSAEAPTAKASNSVAGVLTGAPSSPPEKKSPPLPEETVTSVPAAFASRIC